jgi:prevent-host-death family protein
MSYAVTAAEANRLFSTVLRDVRQGRTVVITAHGKPVARMVPVDDTASARTAARSVLFARLARTRAVRAGRWTRDELYDE